MFQRMPPSLPPSANARAGETMLLTLKKLIARLFFPVPFIFLLLAAGLALLLWPRLGRRCRLAGKILLCAGTALFLLLSVFGGGLLKTLTSARPRNSACRSLHRGGGRQRFRHGGVGAARALVQ